MARTPGLSPSALGRYAEALRLGAGAILLPLLGLRLPLPGVEGWWVQGRLCNGRTGLSWLLAGLGRPQRVAVYHVAIAVALSPLSSRISV